MDYEKFLAGLADELAGGEQPVSEDDEVKESLISDQHRRYYGERDPGDELSDESAWRAYREELKEEDQ